MASPSKKQRTYEARIWRLAYLLTGSTEHATSVVISVARSQNNLTALEPTRLDRIVILRARDYEKIPVRSSIDKFASLVARAWRTVAVIPSEDAQAQETPTPSIAPDAAALLERIVEMDHQPREAWALARVDDVGEMWMARAMDCSRTAAAIHLGVADRYMDQLFEDESKLAAALTSLRDHLDKLDPLPIIDEPKAARKRMWRTIGVVAGVIALIIASLVLALI